MKRTADSLCLFVIASSLLIPGLLSASEPAATTVITVAQRQVPINDCAAGIVYDDGTFEAGYGWIPSAINGRYVQRFEVSQPSKQQITEMCVCWTRIRDDDQIEFSFELYEDIDGVPALLPTASQTMIADNVPSFQSGAFYKADLSSQLDWTPPSSVFYLGVSWNPSIDQFFFVCADQSETTPAVESFFIDDRADEWTSVFETNDPIFDDYRALLIRASLRQLYAVPVLDGFGITLMALLVLVSALIMVSVNRRGL
ncbi:MAG: hypothetical protein GY906_21235 [bacterium]|nr:hypothetical protein [bacterium]